MRAPSLRLLAVLALGGALGGGAARAHSTRRQRRRPRAGARAAQGVVSVATKNTTRLGGADPATDAAAVARAVYPGLTAATRPQAVVLVDEHDWPAALAASALASAPLGAPLLYADGDTLPDATVQALRAMRPLGAAALGGAQVIRIGTSAAVPDGYRTRELAPASDPASAAAAVGRLLAVARGRAPREVILLSADAPRAVQMPAAGLSAESGAPILMLTNATIPAATAAALGSLRRPTIYVIGASFVAARTLAELARYGRVVHVAGSSANLPGASGSSAPGSGGESSDPVENAISVSRFADGSFGWGIHEAGHGLVFANASRPLDAPAAAPLSATATTDRCCCSKATRRCRPRWLTTSATSSRATPRRHPAGARGLQSRLADRRRTRDLGARPG